jgi:glutathionyl-hydroquinone reductase
MLTTPAQTDATGRFRREPSRIRHWISADASSHFPAEPHRYRLYVSYACPWAHRTLIVRSLRRLEMVVPVTNMEPVMDKRGWRLPDGRGHLIDIYHRHDPGYTGRATVPLLLDERTGALVNNESADIMRMLGSAFGADSDRTVELRPAHLVPAVDELNGFIQEHVNEAVYRAGFARSPEARREPLHEIAEAMCELNRRLGSQRYLLGDEAPYEPDWRLWTTLVRYEPVYRPLFFAGGGPCLSEFPNLVRLTEQLAQVPGVAGTLRLAEAVQHFQARMADLNPLATRGLIGGHRL